MNHCYLISLVLTDYDDAPTFPCRIYLDKDLAVLNYHRLTILGKSIKQTMEIYYSRLIPILGAIGVPIDKKLLAEKESEWKEIRAYYLQWVEENIGPGLTPDYLGRFWNPSDWKLDINVIPLELS